MGLLTPDYLFSGVTEITPAFCRRHGYAGLILDIDNTLTRHNAQELSVEVARWLEELRRSGIHCILLSNNHPPRVAPFSKKLGLDYVCEGKKPLPSGYRQAVEKLGLPPQRILAVGDQFFTDVLGAKSAKLKMALCRPIQLETRGFLRAKRVLEIPLWHQTEKRMKKASEKEGT